MRLNEQPCAAAVAQVQIAIPDQKNAADDRLIGFANPDATD
jgi:hypothetical protein